MTPHSSPTSDATSDATTAATATSGVDERVWQRQEAAMRAQRTGAPVAGMHDAGMHDAGMPDADTYDLRDSRVARALATPVDAPLPSNFAYVQAQRIEAIAAERRRADARFVRRLRVGFFVGYGGIVAMIALIWRHELFAGLGLTRLMASPGGAWLPWLLLCVALVLVREMWARTGTASRRSQA